MAWGGSILTSIVMFVFLSVFVIVIVIAHVIVIVIAIVIVMLTQTKPYTASVWTRPNWRVLGYCPQSNPYMHFSTWVLGSHNKIHLNLGIGFN